MFMNKYMTLLCTSLFFMIHSASAQNKNTGNIFKFEDKRFFGSLNVGAVLSQVDGDGFGGYNKIGLSAGPSVMVQVHKNWVVQFGLNYTQKGSRNGNVVGSDLGQYIEKYKLNTHYIDVPIVLNYVFKETYLFGAGLAYSAFISSKEEKYGLNGAYPYDPQEHKFNRHSAEALFNFGAMANKNLMLFLRYHYSVTPIRYYQYNSTGNRNQVNNYFTLGMSYVF